MVVGYIVALKADSILIELWINRSDNVVKLTTCGLGCAWMATYFVWRIMDINIKC